MFAGAGAGAGAELWHALPRWRSAVRCLSTLEYVSGLLPRNIRRFRFLVLHSAP